MVNEHLMVDIETMGKKSTAPILSIGAVFFNPHTGEIGEQFYCAVNLESAMNSGEIPEPDTILWWLKQSAEARAAVCNKEVPSLNEALLQLADYIKANSINPDFLRVWGNGAVFDNVILRESYNRTALPEPWNWFNDRDVRTIVELGREIGFNPKRDMPFDGEPHNALHDAIHQAKYVSAIYQRLLAPHQQN
ncbi:3'-5' exoribonuclease [Serratia fonticola]|nr:3'-5' exoribonuclease [Serratia fonticola]